MDFKRASRWHLEGNLGLVVSSLTDKRNPPFELSPTQSRPGFLRYRTALGSIKMSRSSAAQQTCMLLVRSATGTMKNPFVSCGSLDCASAPYSYRTLLSPLSARLQKPGSCQPGCRITVRPGDCPARKCVAFHNRQLPLTLHIGVVTEQTNSRGISSPTSREFIPSLGNCPGFPQVLDMEMDDKAETSCPTTKNSRPSDDSGT